MSRFLILLSVLSLLACTNSSTSANSKDSLTSNNNREKTSFTPDELEFLGPCFDNAKTQLGEQRAYSLCRCLYDQVQKKYPGADSATLIRHMSDTAEVHQMTKNCQ